ncbi:glycosyltransferase family 2 protein [Bifidobacterium sp. MA2]|uniref:Glycosyltransferase family 2 protein n=1 Tax=Bifidobacterium santillanense TaxID=2809028 RepID=A0ABS5UQJ5_9BIFI|nr:glycosyltransferase family 2 protein [Bifidobacterium santillanense]MBT1173172.1 glycosyltransferase family 2 protein [Bifidobacterium santillanense]
MERTIMPLVSIIIPAYNAENTIARTIKSALLQDYSNLEVIVVDDGSADSTLSICRDLAEKDSRAKIFTIKNSGPSAARNYALSKAKGLYVCFMDADDEMKPKMISQLVSNMTDDTDLVTCGYTVRSDNGDHAFDQNLEERSYSNDHFYEFVEETQEFKAFNPLWNKIFRRSIIENNNLHMDTMVNMGEDYLFIVNYCNMCLGGYKTLADNLYIYSLSQDGLQVTANRDGNLERRLDQIEILDDIFTQRNYPKQAISKEKLRIIYTSLLESNDVRNDLDMIRKNKYLDDIKLEKSNTAAKYTVFLNILRKNNRMIAYTAINLFKLMKKMQGKNFRWR